MADGHLAGPQTEPSHHTESSIVCFLGWDGWKAGLSWDPWPLLHVAWLLSAQQLERERDRDWREEREQGFLWSLPGSSTPTPPAVLLCPILWITDVSLKPAQVQGEAN